jgi:hypothetical protein
MKIVLLVSVFGFIFYKLLYAYHLDELIDRFAFQWDATKVLLLVATCILMLINWMLEASKWRLLITKNESLSFWSSLKAVLSGVALSIITPNQIGDFAGRVLHLKKFDKIKGSLVTVIGHTAQVIMTIAFGGYGFIWFFHAQGKVHTDLVCWLNSIFFLLIISSIIGFLNLHIISKITQSLKFKPYLDVFGLYNRNELLQVLVFSFLRYIVFVVQYVLLLNFYNVEITLEQSISCIVAMLLAQSVVPSFLLVEIGMRGASALFFFTFYTQNVTGVLLSVYSLWIINLMFPALIGIMAIVNLRFKK